MKALAIFAAAAGFAACAIGETITAEPDSLLDYIKATGTQYIDTGVNAETGLKSSVDFAWASGNISTNDWSLLDAADPVTSSSDNRSHIFMCHMVNGKPFFGYGKGSRGNPSGSVEFVGGERCTIVTDITDTNSLELVQNGVNTFGDEDRTKYGTNGVVNLNRNLFVFACNYGGNASWHGQGRLYELKIWKRNAESGELDLVRHYLPCVKDDRAGLYDEVEGKISYSYGVDDFVAGAVTNAPMERVAGNAWHVPASVDAWGRPMRDPLEPCDGAEPILRLEGQSDVEADRMTAADIKYRIGTSGAWSSIPMGLEAGAGGEGSQNACWSNALPALVEGQTVQYYFKAVFGNSASLGTTYVYDDHADGCDKSVEEADAQVNPFEFTVSAPPNYTDPQGVEIEDPSIAAWIKGNGFTQSDINALGEDSEATDKLYECYMLNCDFTEKNPGGALSITGIAVSNDQVSVMVQLVRQSPFGAIYGALHLYGASDLAAGFGRRPIADEALDFGDGKSTFDTLPTAGSVTQTVSATFGTRSVTEKFFKAVIEFPIPEEPEDPEPEGE